METRQLNKIIVNNNIIDGRLNKIIVLTGDDTQAKENLIRVLIMGKESAHISIFDYNKKKSNYWHNFIEKTTEVVVFENQNIRNGLLEDFFDIFTHGISVQRTENSDLFKIRPLVIINALTWDKVPYQGASFVNRFDFFNLTKSL